MILDTLIFDYGGVVADHYSDPYLSLLATELGTTRSGARQLVSERTPHGKAYRLDQLTNKGFWNEVRQLAPRKDFDDKTVQELWSKTYIPNQAVFALLDHLKNSLGVQIGLILNEDRERMQFIINEYAIYQYVSITIASFEVGVMKPDKKIYEIALQKSCRVHEPAKVLYVDDRQSHVQPAINCGINGYVYVNAGELNNFLEDITLVNFKP